MNIEKLHWKKSWSGKWSILECSYFGIQYTTSLKEEHGIGLHNVLIEIGNGHSTCLVVQEEAESYGKHIAELIEKDHNVAKTYSDHTKALTDKLLAFLKDDSNITKEKYNTLWILLDTFLRFNNVLKVSADHLSAPTLKKLMPLLEETRLYSEPVYSESGKFLKRFASQLESETGLPAKTILCMKKDELEAYLETKTLPDTKELDKRYEKSYLLVSDGVPRLLNSAEISTFENRVKDDSIMGQTGYKGIVKGKVRIVKDPRKITDYEDDSILVTEMTRPEYMELIKKSAAVVTDAGGVLSHAAITAREFKIPCVIGTETATKILKDGDLVEVDAEKGVVKRI